MNYPPSSVLPDETNGELLPFSEVFKHQAGLILLFSPDLIILAATDAYLQETFTTREHILGRHAFEVFPDNPQALEVSATNNLLASVQEVLATKQRHQIDLLQYDIPDPNHPGQFLERYWSTTNTPVLTAEGRISCIIHEIINVSEKVKSERQLQASRQREQKAWALADQQRVRLERLFKQAPAALAMLEGPDLIYKVLNDSYQQLFPGRELLSLPLFEALPELKEQPIAAVIRQVYQTGNTYEGKEVLIPVARYQDQAPEDIYWNFIYQALLDEQGQVNGILIFALDVTGLVQARQLVEQSAATLHQDNQELEERVTLRTRELQGAQMEAERQRQLLHTLFMEAPAPIVILEGPELIYRLVNPAYQQIFPGRTLLNKALLEALPEVADTPIWHIIKQVYETGETYVAQEMPLQLARHQEGPLEEIYWTFTYQARRNSQGAIDGVLVFAYEVTDQVKARQVVEQSEQQAKALAEELAQTNSELQAANQQLTRTNIDLDSFIYTASHDLKAPILNIEGLMEALLNLLPPDSLQPAPVQQTTGLIADSVQRFKNTIEQLTEVSRLQKVHTGQASAIDLAAVIAAVQLDLNPVIQASQATFLVEVGACPTIYFSSKNLRSIIYNLLSNALKYRSPERPLLIRVHCLETAEYQVLTVTDNGLGIDPAQHHKLFRMFYRLHNHGEGSGIGLFMVKRMMDNAQGKIEVESQEGVGTTFKLYFPKL